MPHLPPAHHETSKRDSSNETKIEEKQKQNYPGFEFKPCQVNDSSHKPSTRPLGFSWLKEAEEAFEEALTSLQQDGKLYLTKEEWDA
jgi:hypothetical protein